ncbi:VWA domain-containing protein [Ornithinibacillus sp. L9]|uniref:VWA domain-containing protein n=1 Tax=Ornithinibacillus caprae TaxID=2678566 RepID=A0A6N8FM82_9BACI|nr:VWA domain-containing protein [Ornithinibacillus caprae]MUK90281.1 VWA domain-containing protein [Ornithinibacillus caprae]
MYRSLVAILFVLVLVLFGCSKDDSNDVSGGEGNEREEKTAMTEEKKEEQSEPEAVQVMEELESIVLPETREEMKDQLGGLLVNDVSLENELELDMDAFLQEIDEELREQLVTLTTVVEDPFELEKGLAFLLGTANYKEVLEQAEEFEPDFEEPYLPYPGKTKEEIELEPEAGKAIILLDASSSMLLSVDGEVKMDIAKDAVKRFADVIGQDNEVSLVVYGHQGSESSADKELSCNGIEKIYEMGAYNKDNFEASLSTFESKGWTPLAGAIHKAAEMSTNVDGAITLYIVSDGVETCDGDPVHAAENFVEQNEHRSVNIIGFDVDQDAEEQLKNVSEAGNGEYYSADDATELKQTIEYEWLPSRIDLAWAFTKAPGPWEILDEREKYDTDHQKIKTIIDKERERYDYALHIIREKELILDDKRGVLQDLISERYGARVDEWRNIRSDKIEEIDEVANEIKERVNEWTEEMKKRKDERGDVW